MFKWSGLPAVSPPALCLCGIRGQMCREFLGSGQMLLQLIVGRIINYDVHGSPYFHDYTVFGHGRLPKLFVVKTVAVAI